MTALASAVTELASLVTPHAAQSSAHSFGDSPRERGH